MDIPSCSRYVVILYKGESGRGEGCMRLFYLIHAQNNRDTMISLVLPPGETGQQIMFSIIDGWHSFLFLLTIMLKKKNRQNLASL